MIGSVTPVTSDSWNASEPTSLLPTCPVMQTIGERVHHRRRDAGHHVRRAGTRRRDRDADLAAGARIAVGHVRRALLVPHEHVADRIVEHRVVGRKNGAAGIAEDVGHALPNETFPDDLRSCAFHTSSFLVRVGPHPHALPSLTLRILKFAADELLATGSKLPTLPAS